MLGSKSSASINAKYLPFDFLIPKFLDKDTPRFLLTINFILLSILQRLIIKFKLSLFSSS